MKICGLSIVSNLVRGNIMLFNAVDYPKLFDRWRHLKNIGGRARWESGNGRSGQWREGEMEEGRKEAVHRPLAQNK